MSEPGEGLKPPEPLVLRQAKEIVDKALAGKPPQGQAEQPSDQIASQKESWGVKEGELSALYKQLTDTLDTIKINPQTVNFSITSYRGPYEFIGAPGSFEFYFQQDHIEIRRKTTASRAADDKNIHEDYIITPQGYGSYSKREITEKGNKVIDSKNLEEGSIFGEKRKNEQLVIKHWSELVSDLSQSIENPEHNPDQMREKFKELHGFLVDFFGEKGITPRNISVVAKSLLEQEKATAQAVFTPEQTQELRDSQPLTEEVGYVYQNVQIPGTQGTWDIKFDIDCQREYRALFKIAFNQQIRAHGTGVILTHKTPPADKKNQWGQKLDKYEIWVNGDASFSTEELYLDGKVAPGTSKYGDLDKTRSSEDRIINPHLVLTQMNRLKEMLTNPQTPQPQKNTFQRLLRR